jgi:ubiquinone/menaquinone biosynthesis C-methylase UbiE
MSLSAREKAKLDSFDAIYQQGQLPVMRAIERRICGCAYGATSWATRDEADLIVAALGLAPAVELLEVGAGSGWPALYFAVKSGCDVTLTDLPLSGLTIALKRAVCDGIDTHCRVVAADGAWLPFSDASFDVVNQSDVLCCLVQKEDVLRECRRVIRPGRRMACSLIHVPVGLGAEDHARAVETAPDFVEAEPAYPALFEASGWAIVERHDLTEAFTQTCREKLRAEEKFRADLERVVGAVELERQFARMRRRIAVLERGHLKRELFFLKAVS